MPYRTVGIGRFRIKSVEIEAMQLADSSGDAFLESCKLACRWVNSFPEVVDQGEEPSGDPTLSFLTSTTVGGTIFAHDVLLQAPGGPEEVHPGDWIIKGVANEFYSCSPEIFANTYEPVETGGSMLPPLPSDLEKVLRESAKQQLRVACRQLSAAVTNLDVATSHGSASRVNRVVASVNDILKSLEAGNAE